MIGAARRRGRTGRRPRTKKGELGRGGVSAAYLAARGQLRACVRPARARAWQPAGRSERERERPRGRRGREQGRGGCAAGRLPWMRPRAAAAPGARPRGPNNYPGEGSADARPRDGRARAGAGAGTPVICCTGRAPRPTRLIAACRRASPAEGEGSAGERAGGMRFSAVNTLSEQPTTSWKSWTAIRQTMRQISHDVGQCALRGVRKATSAPPRPPAPTSATSAAEWLTTMSAPLAVCIGAEHSA